MLTDIPPAYGYLNDCQEHNGKLVLSEWLLLLDGPFEGFQARLANGETLDVTQLHHQNLADAIPQIPRAADGGFHAEIPMPDLAPGDFFDVQILGLRAGEPAGSMMVGYHRPTTPQEYPPSDVMKRAASGDSRPFWRATGIKACNDFRRTLRPRIDLSKVERVSRRHSATAPRRPRWSMRSARTSVSTPMKTRYCTASSPSG